MSSVKEKIQGLLEVNEKELDKVNISDVPLTLFVSSLVEILHYR